MIILGEVIKSWRGSNKIKKQILKNLNFFCRADYFSERSSYFQLKITIVHGIWRIFMQTITECNIERILCKKLLVKEYIKIARARYHYIFLKFVFLFVTQKQYNNMYIRNSKCLFNSIMFNMKMKKCRMYQPYKIKVNVNISIMLVFFCLLNCPSLTVMQFNSYVVHSFKL